MIEEWARRQDEKDDEWLARMERDWPETLKNIRIFAMLDENRKRREGEKKKK